MSRDKAVHRDATRSTDHRRLKRCFRTVPWHIRPLRVEYRDQRRIAPGEQGSSVAIASVMGPAKVDGEKPWTFGVAGLLCAEHKPAAGPFGRLHPQLSMRV